MQRDREQLEKCFDRMKAYAHGLIEEGFEMLKEFALAKIEAQTMRVSATTQAVITTTNATNKLMTAAEVAAEFGFKRATVYQWRKKGLPSHRFNKQHRYYRHEVLAWTTQHKDLIERGARS